jgi:hypothetical protein
MPCARVRVAPIPLQQTGFIEGCCAVDVQQAIDRVEHLLDGVAALRPPLAAVVISDLLSVRCLTVEFIGDVMSMQPP